MKLVYALIAVAGLCVCAPAPAQADAAPAKLNALAIIGGLYPVPPKGQPQVTGAIGYEHGVEVPVVIADTKHPITAGLRDFAIRDEIYRGFRVGADVHPLLTTPHPKSGKPLMWTRAEGKSRVVFLQLGHDHLAYDNPNFRELVARSIAWATQR